MVLLGGAALIFGIEGLGTSIQIVNVFAVANLNLAEAISIQLFTGLVSCVVMTIMATFLSAKQNKSINSLFSGIAFFALYELANFFLAHMNSFIDILLTIIPISGTGMISIVQQHNSILDIFGIGVWIPYVSIIAGIIWGVILIIMTLRIYTKHEC